MMIQARGFQPADEDDDSDDDFSDDEELHSPIDEVDPFIFFVETVQGKLFFANRCLFSLEKKNLVEFLMSCLAVCHRFAGI
jgi:hypothetical protein